MSRAPQHHPSDETLVAFAAGALDLCATVTVKVHLDGCPACRNTVDMLSRFGASLMLDMPDEPLSAGSLDRALAQLDQLPRTTSPPPPSLDLSPAKLMWVGPGLRVRRICQDRESTLQICTLASGSCIPMHGHGGLEVWQVLSGQLADGHHTYAAGDAAECNEPDEHEPRAVGNAPCVALIYLASKPLYRNPLARLRAALVGI